jgi:hypothetical protein
MQGLRNGRFAWTWIYGHHTEGQQTFWPSGWQATSRDDRSLPSSTTSLCCGIVCPSRRLLPACAPPLPRPETRHCAGVRPDLPSWTGPDAGPRLPSGSQARGTACDTPGYCVSLLQTRGLVCPSCTHPEGAMRYLTCRGHFSPQRKGNSPLHWWAPCLRRGAYHLPH